MAVDPSVAGPSVTQTMSGLSLEEENDMRVEHALEILKADVSASNQYVLDLAVRELSVMSRGMCHEPSPVNSMAKLMLFGIISNSMPHVAPVV